jgi:hypothetical protein
LIETARVLSPADYARPEPFIIVGHRMAHPVSNPTAEVSEFIRAPARPV